MPERRTIGGTAIERRRDGAAESKVNRKNQSTKGRRSSPITTRVTFLMSTPGAFLTLHW